MPLAQDSTKASHKPAAKVGKTRASKPKPASKVLAEEEHRTPKRRVQQAKGDTPPAVTEVEPVIIGHGDYAFSMRKFVQHRPTFVGETVSKTPFSREYVEMRANEIEDASYRRFDQDNLRVDTEDGFGLVIVVKNGMWAGKSGMEAELRGLRPLSKNSPKPILLRLPEKRTIGTHLAPWHMAGHPNDPLRLSAHAVPADPTHKEAVAQFMQKTAWEHDQISKVLMHLDRPAWEESNRHYRKLRDKQSLDHLDQGPNGIHSGLAPIVNLTVQPHRDPEDARLSWTSTNTWCHYEGAWVVFPYLKIMIKQEPGDIIFCRSAYLEHWVTKITKGERYCNTRFSKENVQNPLDPWVKCPVPGCDNKPMGRVDSLHYHVKKHSALTDAEVESIITSLEDEASAFSAADAHKIAHYLRVRKVLRKRRKPKDDSQDMGGKALEDDTLTE